MSYIIYKISDINNTECYIGSTKRKLNDRFLEHKSRYNTNSEFKYTSYKLFDKYGTENCKIEMLKDKIDTKNEAKKEECNFIKAGLNCVNRKVETRTRKEWLEDNKEYVKESKKKDYLKNRDKILNKAKQIIKCECGRSFRADNMTRHKKTQLHIELLNN